MSRRRSTAGRLLVVAALVAALVPAHALAAEATSAAKPGIGPLVEATNISAQLWPSEGTGTKPNAVIVVGATVATSVPLPCRVRLPLPEGASLSWAGQISGVAPEQDIVEEPVTVEVAGGKALELTLTKYREAQYEADWTAPVKKGDKYVAKLDWAQVVSSRLLQVAVMVRQDATDVQITPAPEGPPQVQGGDQLYLLPERTGAVGTKVPLEVTFGFGVELPTPTSGGLSSQTVVILGVLVLLLAIAVVALFVMMSRQRRE